MKTENLTANFLSLRQGEYPQGERVDDANGKVKTENGKLNRQLSLPETWAKRVAIPIAMCGQHRRGGGGGYKRKVKREPKVDARRG